MDSLCVENSIKVNGIVRAGEVGKTSPDSHRKGCRLLALQPTPDYITGKVGKGSWRKN